VDCNIDLAIITNEELKANREIQVAKAFKIKLIFSAKRIPYSDFDNSTYLILERRTIHHVQTNQQNANSSIMANRILYLPSYYPLRHATVNDRTKTCSEVEFARRICRCLSGARYSTSSSRYQP